MPTLYERLGVARNADTHTIERAFRAEGFKYHPDRNPGNEQAVETFKALTNARDILVDPGKRAEYDSQLESDDNTNSDDEGYLDSEYDTGESDRDSLRKAQFCQRFYTTTPRNYRSQYSGDPCTDNYDEHRHYAEEYTPQGSQRHPDDDDPLEEHDRAHCLYEPYTPGPGLKRCQGCKEHISPDHTECQKAKHIVDRSKFYVTKCCGYPFHTLCYRRALFNNVDPQGRFRCAVCHNYAEGDVVYHAFDLDIFPDVNFKTSPSPWRICNDKIVKPYINDHGCRCYRPPNDTYREERQCRCFTGSCFVCRPDDQVRWMFHLLRKRVIDRQDYLNLVFRLGQEGDLEQVEWEQLYGKIVQAMVRPPRKFFDSNPGPKSPEQKNLIRGVGETVKGWMGRLR